MARKVLLDGPIGVFDDPFQPGKMALWHGVRIAHIDKWAMPESEQVRLMWHVLLFGSIKYWSPKPGRHKPKPT